MQLTSKPFLFAWADDGCWPGLAEMEVFGNGQAPLGEQYTPFRSSFGSGKPEQREK
ncbi:MAG: hypothetical protein ABSG78_12170 [Verrucomicrobiota bacterium]|jgi:hypothetical protein